MELLVIRHAKAEKMSSDGSDHSRELSERGKWQAQCIGNDLRDRGCEPDLILASPLVRTQQTARGMIAKELITAPRLTCGAGPDEILSELRAYVEFDRIAIVGHEPDLSTLVAQLIGADAYAIEMKPGTVARLAMSPSLNHATLCGLIPVKE